MKLQSTERLSLTPRFADPEFANDVGSSLGIGFAALEAAAFYHQGAGKGVDFRAGVAVDFAYFDHFSSIGGNDSHFNAARSSPGASRSDGISSSEGRTATRGARHNRGVPRVVVVGSANMDLVVHSPRFPFPGETLLGGPFSTHPGGKGANAAVAAARLGADVALVGMIGRDAFGDALLGSLREAGVETDRLLRAENAPTGVALITVATGGENTIVVAPGANVRVAPEDVSAALDALRPSVTLVSLEIPIDAVAACAAAPGLLIVNPAPAAELPEKLWPRIDLLTPNAAETRFYTDIDPVDDAACLAAAERFFALGARQVLITLGARGSFLATPEAGHPIPELAVRAVDTTGAGDALNGALATFLAEGRNLGEAALLANCAAALACKAAGAQEAMPTREEVRELGLLGS